MTELEQYKKAYAILVGRVDQVLSTLSATVTSLREDQKKLLFTATVLASSLIEVEDIFISEDPEEEPEE